MKAEYRGCQITISNNREKDSTYRSQIVVPNLSNSGTITLDGYGLTETDCYSNSIDIIEAYYNRAADNFYKACHSEIDVILHQCIDSLVSSISDKYHLPSEVVQIIVKKCINN